MDQKVSQKDYIVLLSGIPWNYLCIKFASALSCGQSGVPDPTLVVCHCILHPPPEIRQPLLVVVVLEVLGAEALNVDIALGIGGLDGRSFL